MPRKILTAVIAAVAVGLMTMSGVQAQQKAGKAAALTAMDHIEIQQLVARAERALDTGADDGRQYAELFTTDGESVRPAAKGREQLAAFAKNHLKDERSALVRDFVTNLVIFPAAQGATGKAYLVAFNLGESGKSSVVMDGGHYEDVYVKTAAGWRIRKRDFIASKTGVPE